MDDACVISAIFEDHLKRLDSVFEALLHSVFVSGQINAVLLCERLTSAVTRSLKTGYNQFPPTLKQLLHSQFPAHPREVKTLLGATGWYRKFIPRYAELAKPLIQLTKQGRENVWTEKCQTAFEDLKHILTSAPILTHPSPSSQFTLTTDASPIGIVYFGQTLSKAERNYSTYGRELLAIVTAIRNFRHYLLETYFILRSNHQPLQFLKTAKDPWGRHARWLVDLQQYNFTVEHVKGTQNPVADALRRLCGAMGNPHPPSHLPLLTDWTHELQIVFYTRKWKILTFKLSLHTFGWAGAHYLTLPT